MELTAEQLAQKGFSQDQIATILGTGVPASPANEGPSAPQTSANTNPLLTLAANYGIHSALGSGSTSTAPSAMGADSALSSVALPAAAIIGGVYQANRAVNAIKNKNANVAGIAGSLAGGIGTGGLAALAAKSNIMGGKSKDQTQRDAIRSQLQDFDLADKDYNVTLADGTQYNIGSDGHASLQNVGKNIDGSTSRHPYDVDFSNPLAKAAVPTLNALAAQILGAGASQKQISDEVGMLDNAVTSNAKSQDDVNKNIAALQGKIPKNDATPSTGGDKPAQADLSALSGSLSQLERGLNSSNQASTDAAKKAALLGKVGSLNKMTPESFNYSSLLKNQYG